MTPQLIQILEDAAAMAARQNDSYVRICHVEAVLGKSAPPSPISPRSPIVRRKVIPTRPCPECGKQLRKWERHKIKCLGLSANSQGRERE